MIHAELTPVDAATPVTLPDGSSAAWNTRILTAPVFLGLVSNYQTTVLHGQVLVAGSLTGLTVTPPATVGPATFALGAPAGNVFPYTVTVPRLATPGLHQARIAITNASNQTIGRFIVSLIVLDMAAANVEDLQPPVSLSGVGQFLQVNANTDFVRLP